MSKSLVYIAGPFRASTPWGVVQNIRAAEEAALHVTQMGAVAVCPHTMWGNLGGAVTDEVWLENGLELLRRCDALLLVGSVAGVGGSSGTQAEIVLAHAMITPVFYTYEDLEDWLTP